MGHISAGRYRQIGLFVMIIDPSGSLCRLLIGEQSYPLQQALLYQL